MYETSQQLHDILNTYPSLYIINFVRKSSQPWRNNEQWIFILIYRSFFSILRIAKLLLNVRSKS